MRVSGEDRAPLARWPYTGQSPAEACRLASSSRISSDFPRDEVAQVAKLVLAAESKEAFDDAAVPVQQHGVRQPAVMICRLHAPAANENGEWRAKLTHERAHLAAADVVRDRGDVEVGPLELAVQLRHVREFLPAGRAPGGPEIHERDFAAILLEPNRLPVEVGQSERRLEQVASAGWR